MEGLGLLDDHEFNSELLVHHASLVVFTDGSDQAALIDNETAIAEAFVSEHEVYTIGLGVEVDTTHLQELGKSGAVLANDTDGIIEAFNEIGNKVCCYGLRPIDVRSALFTQLCVFSQSLKRSLKQRQRAVRPASVPILRFRNPSWTNAMQWRLRNH